MRCAVGLLGGVDFVAAKLDNQDVYTINAKLDVAASDGRLLILYKFV